VPAALAVLRPDATCRLERLNERVWASVDPTLLELMRLRIAWLLGDTVGTRTRSARARAAGLGEAKIGELAAYPTSARFSALEREVLAFAEQFVMDVSGTTPETLDVLAGQLGVHDLREFITAVFVVEFTQRLQLVGHTLFAAREQPDRPRNGESVAGASLRELLDDYQAAVMRGRHLDAVTTELVRLRCARTHRCRICQTLRLDEARAAGVDDTTTSKIDFYDKSDLPERSKVALRITDAVIIRPDELSAETVERAHALFSADELAELCFDITKWSTQKIHVALGIDGAEALPTGESGVAVFGFQEDGRTAGYRAG